MAHCVCWPQRRRAVEALGGNIPQNQGLGPARTPEDRGVAKRPKASCQMLSREFSIRTTASHPPTRMAVRKGRVLYAASATT